MTNMSNSNLKTDDKKIWKDRQVLKKIKNLKEYLQRDALCPSAIEDETIEEMTKIAFCRMIRSDIVTEDDFEFIYYLTANIEKKDKVYELFRICKDLQLQELASKGIISEKKLNHMLPKPENLRFSIDFNNCLINISKGLNYVEEAEEEELDECKLWALYQITLNSDIKEEYFPYFYDEIVGFEFNDENVVRETSNIIARLKIQELFKNGFIDEYDKTNLMSKLPFMDSDYIFFSDDEIIEWKSKAYKHFIKIKSKRERWY